MRRMIITIRTKSGSERRARAWVQELEGGELVAGYCGHCYHFSVENGKGIFIHKP